MAYTDIDKPDEYFNTKLYTGDGTDGRGITGVGFQPDWCWFKARSTAYENQVYDVVRGATKRLVTNDTTAEGTQTNGLQSFDSDGFTVGNANGTNVNAVTYASWNWLASNTTTSNTDGSITSTVSANTTSGFSIVTYTGSGTSSDTVGHGLGAVPALIIGKNRDSGARSWPVKHKDLSSNNTLYLNLNNAQASPGDGTFANLDNSSTFGFYSGSNADNVNQSGQNFIAYCFAEKKGFSKFGSYTGNGSADGPFIYTGFKPAFLLIKRTDAAYNWYIHDNKRNPFNVMDKELYPSLVTEEGTAVTKDFVSNGVKIRGTQVSQNASGGTYIYMAFAENPFVTSNRAIPATAR
jgi:hypothetical protein